MQADSFVENKVEIKKGQLIALTTGEYSNYTLCDHVRALKDFNSGNEITRFMETGDYLIVPEWSTANKPNSIGAEDRFIAWAISEKLIEPLEADEVIEWYIGSYGNLETE